MPARCTGSMSQGAVDPHRHRAAQSRHHLGAGLPARRHPARSRAELPGRRRRGRPADIEAAFACAGEGALAERLAHEGVAPTGHRAAAHDRHDVPGPVALACGATRQSRSARSRTSVEASTPSTSANTISAATGPGRLVPPQPEGGRRRAQGRARDPRADRRDRLSRDEPPPGLVRETGRGSIRRSTGAPDSGRASTFTGPAIVEQVDSTTVVPPGASAEVDKYLNIILRVKA